jgi:hypothetical protein
MMRERWYLKKKQVTHLYDTIRGQDYPRKPRVAKVFKDEVEMDDCIRSIKIDKDPKTKSAKEFCLQQTKLHLIILILATGTTNLP